MMPDVVVVIVNFRTGGLTAAAVTSVLGEECVAEVVIVDNHSGDGSAEYLAGRFARQRVRILEMSRNVGFGQGAHAGVRASSAPLVFLLNSDAVVERGSIGQLRLTLLSAPEVALVAPTVLRPDRRVQQDSFGTFPRFHTLIFRTNRRPLPTPSPDWVCGAAMLMRRADYESVGGFDPEYYMFFEDVDLCRRLRAGGREIRRDLRASVVHVGAGSSLPRAPRHYHASQLVYFRRRGAGRLVLASLRAVGWVRNNKRADPFG